MYWAWKNAPLQLYADTTDRDVQNGTARWSVKVGVAADRSKQKPHASRVGRRSVSARGPRAFRSPLGHGVVKGRDRRRTKILCALRNSVGCAVRGTVTLSALLNRRAQSGHLPRPHAMLKGTPMSMALRPAIIRESSLTSIVALETISGPSWRPTCPPVMKPGDVLVSRPTARADVYDISVVPAVPRVSNVRYEDGMETGRQLARELAVDGWFTCDHTHVVPIAKHRR
jgi:hypothetical protein